MVFILVVFFILLHYGTDETPPKQKNPYRQPYTEDKNTTIITPSAKEISIKKELKIEPNKLVIPPEDDAFRR